MKMSKNILYFATPITIPLKNVLVGQTLKL